MALKKTELIFLLFYTNLNFFLGVAQDITILDPVTFYKKNVSVTEHQKTQIKKYLTKNKIDTSNFIYTPIINVFLSNKIDSEYFIINNNIKDTTNHFLSEILISRKKDNIIIGSYYFCSDGGGFIHFLSSKYGHLSTVPCRSENRLAYLSKEYYKKIKKNLIKHKQGGIFATINNIGGLIYFSENGEAELIYP